MELIDYVRMLRRRWAWIVVFTVLGVAAGVTWVLVAPKSYTATTEIFVAGVVSDADTSPSVAAESSSNYVLDRMPSYAALVNSPDVLASVNQQLSLELTPADLKARVAAVVPAKTVLLRVTAQDSDPRAAAWLADAAALGLTRTIEQLESTTLGGQSPVSAKVYRPASVPSAPTSPDRTLSLGLGLVVGLGLGLATAALRDQALRRDPDPAGSRRASTSRVMPVADPVATTPGIPPVAAQPSAPPPMVQVPTQPPAPAAPPPPSERPDPAPGAPHR